RRCLRRHWQPCSIRRRSPSRGVSMRRDRSNPTCILGLDRGTALVSTSPKRPCSRYSDGFFCVPISPGSPGRAVVWSLMDRRRPASLSRFDCFKPRTIGRITAMPNCITIITPIKLSSTERCRRYLRDNAEPQAGMQCKAKFGFDRIRSLHFASFVILDAAADFEPSLVFEATFDGSKGDFVSDLLQVAGNGMYELYQ